MTDRQDLVDALDAATKYPVFPLLGKVPAIRNSDHHIPRGQGGSKLASHDPTRVRELWGMAQTSYPGETSFNIGVATGREIIVIDVDSHKATTPQQRAELQRLAPLWENHPTRQHQTKNGGVHHVYKLPDNAPSVRNLPIGEVVDIRCIAGHVAWPPSAGYAVLNDIEPVEIDRFTLNRVLQLQQEQTIMHGGSRPDPSMTEEELVDAVYRGEHLHDTLFALARLYATQSRPQGEALQLCRAALDRSIRKRRDPASWNERSRDLERTVTDAYARARPPWDEIKHSFASGINALLRVRAAEAEERVEDRIEEREQERSDIGLELYHDELINLEVPPIDWLIPDLLPKGNLVSITGPSGVGKTRWVAALVASLAAGRTEKMGLPVAAQRARVAWFGNEERTSDLLRRVKGAVQVLGLEDEESAPVLYRGKDRGVLRLLDDNGAELEKVLDLLVERLQDFGADLVILDPMISLGVEDENASASVAALMRALLRLSTETGATVLIVHHSPKDRQAAPDALRGDYGAWRGSGAIFSTLDVGVTLMPWIPSEVHAAGKQRIKDLQQMIRDGRAPSFIVADMAKQREGQTLRSQLWEIINHQVSDREGNVGVIRPRDEAEARGLITSAMNRAAAEALQGVGGMETIVELSQRLEELVPEGKREAKITREELIGAQIIPHGTRMNRGAGADLMQAFAKPVGTPTGNSVQLVRSTRRGPGGSVEIRLSQRKRAPA